MSSIEREVIAKIESRAAAGLAKYGTDMERNDLSRREWLQHAQDELLDGAVYLQKLMSVEGGE